MNDALIKLNPHKLAVLAQPLSPSDSAIDGDSGTKISSTEANTASTTLSTTLSTTRGGLVRGIEKESLRVRPNGELSTLPHPHKLGSALTHPSITTDFSEAQLELITTVHPTPQACLKQLNDVHRFVYQNIDDELLWPSSMPCIVSAESKSAADTDSKIPVGQYGRSNIGQAKTVYRRGLGLRYGRLMQTISGIHYNFSLSPELWAALGITDQDEITNQYFALIRNFRRWSWLLLYLFGASPAVCKSFTKHLPHGLQSFDEGSHHLPYATCLRMGPLGYQSSAQSNLNISYNSLEQYANSMEEALTTTYPQYAEHGTIKDGEYHQLNTSILQIENEFYGTIRPKRRINSGERPISALRDRGVEYVEVRCLDLNPFLEVGIDAQQMRFIDTFLLMCLFAESADDSIEEIERMARNQLKVVEQGRKPGLSLEATQGENLNGQTESLTSAANTLLQACEQISQQLDIADDSNLYQDAVKAQKGKIDDAATTPSARVLAEMKQQNIPFFRFTMNQALAHQKVFAEQPLSNSEIQQFDQEVADSITQQHSIEAKDTQSFAEFLDDYLAL